jgi:nicotinate-nucleotide pyrophosphorylase (carboxylating)
MTKDFQQMNWNEHVEQDCRALVRLAIHEDLDQQQDWTTNSLIPPDIQGRADIVSRQAGVVAGLPALVAALAEMQACLLLTPALQEGDSTAPDTVVATLSGKVRDLLTWERILLNLLGRLMGIATLAGQYAQAVSGTGARVYDTRKTTPGWRRLEKYAVRCGGVRNHRTGLFDAVLIKDNHLALLGSSGQVMADASPAAAVRRVRDFLAAFPSTRRPTHCLIEVEVDTIEQLSVVLPAKPDIVLLDNMPAALLRKAVHLRNTRAPEVQLEASGGIGLQQIREIAETGVERISIGALTHSARSLDVGLDWRETMPIIAI